MANEAYHTQEYFKQHRSMIINGDPRALICFCIDVSRSMGDWWIEEGGFDIERHKKVQSDGHTVAIFDPNDVRPGYACYRKIEKLNAVIRTLLTELKEDEDICDKVAVSIVVYSRYGKVKYDFLDCSEIDIKACECSPELPETAMADGIRTALAQIDEMERDLKNVGKDAYTPLLVFLTDGTPTDDPKKEFAAVRERVEDGSLFVFPLGIGDGAEMSVLRDMFPIGKVPEGFSERYKMVMPEDYDTIFREIKSHVKQKQSVMVSEGNSAQSKPAIEKEGVTNNQMGQSIMDFAAMAVHL